MTVVTALVWFLLSFSSLSQGKKLDVDNQLLEFSGLRQLPLRARWASESVNARSPSLRGQGNKITAPRTFKEKCSFSLTPQFCSFPSEASPLAILAPLLKRDPELQLGKASLSAEFLWSVPALAQ